MSWYTFGQRHEKMVHILSTEGDSHVTCTANIASYPSYSKDQQFWHIKCLLWLSPPHTAAFSQLFLQLDSTLCIKYINIIRAHALMNVYVYIHELLGIALPNCMFKSVVRCSREYSISAPCITSTMPVLHTHTYTHTHTYNVVRVLLCT